MLTRTLPPRLASDLRLDHFPTTLNLPGLGFAFFAAGVERDAAGEVIFVTYKAATGAVVRIYND